MHCIDRDMQCETGNKIQIHEFKGLLDAKNISRKKVVDCFDNYVIYVIRRDVMLRLQSNLPGMSAYTGLIVSLC